MDQLLAGSLPEDKWREWCQREAGIPLVKDEFFTQFNLSLEFWETCQGILPWDPLFLPLVLWDNQVISVGLLPPDPSEHSTGFIFLLVSKKQVEQIWNFYHAKPLVAADPASLLELSEEPEPESESHLESEEKLSGSVDLESVDDNHETPPDGLSLESFAPEGFVLRESGEEKAPIHPVKLKILSPLSLPPNDSEQNPISSSSSSNAAFSTQNPLEIVKAQEVLPSGIKLSSLEQMKQHPLCQMVTFNDLESKLTKFQKHLSFPFERIFLALVHPERKEFQVILAKSHDDHLTWMDSPLLSLLSPNICSIAIKTLKSFYGPPVQNALNEKIYEIALENKTPEVIALVPLIHGDQAIGLVGVSMSKMHYDLKTLSSIESCLKEIFKPHESIQVTDLAKIA
jgi:hypothetical protein